MDVPRRLPMPPGPVRRRVADALVVGVVAVAALADRVWERTDHPGWQWTAAAAVTALALLARRRMPLTAVLAVLMLWATVRAERAVDDPPFQFVALLVGAYALGAHARLRHGLAGLAAMGAVFSVLNLTRGEGPGAAVAGILQFSVMFAFGRVIAGAAERELALRSRAAQLESERDARAAEAVAEERRRIARDLHDALGHAVSVLVLQVGAVRMRLRDDQQEEREMLGAAERTGRDSVVELRRMLGMLREAEVGATGGPAGLAAVEDVAAAVRAAGVRVDLEVTGEPSAPPAGVDVAAFRIVQEALTNVLRHAPDAHARVHVAYEPDAVVLEVVDDGAGRPARAPDPGHGLIGMRERVALYGGTLDAEPAGDCGFAVRARLPFGRDGG